MELFKHFKRDAAASVVVFFVAVPLCLGIALASGAPLISGLIAGIIGGLIVGSISQSQLGVSGPAAGLAVIVLAAINQLGFEAFLLAVVLAGVIQIVMGIARGGFIAHFFPSSVIKGMLAGIGIIIILKQIPHAFGHDTNPEGSMAFQQPDGDTTISSFFSIKGDLDGSAMFVSFVALMILIFWEMVISKSKSWLRQVPGPVVAVGFGILFQVGTRQWYPDYALSSNHLVSVPVAESLESFANLLVMPDWSSIVDPAVLVAAVTIALVASLETLLCVEATDKLDPDKRVTPTNRELVAQGAGNMFSGLIGGLPITQVIVRSSANIQTGAKTKLSAILHGALLLVFLVALPGLLNLIPLAVLASILFVVGYKLAKPSLFKTVYRQGLAHFTPFIVTILGIVFTDLLIGIGLGLAVAILHILYGSYRNSFFLHMIQSDGDTGRTVRLRLAEEVTFLNRGAIIRVLSDIEDDTKVVIDAHETVYIHDDVREAIADFTTGAEKRGIVVEFIENKDKAPAAALAS